MSMLGTVYGGGHHYQTNTIIMFHKNSTEEDSEMETFPFSESHIVRFKNELEKAGSFEELMIKKLALRRENGAITVLKFTDVDNYKEIFLNGVYASLKEFYDIDVPYLFWSELHKVVERRDNYQKSE